VRQKESENEELRSDIYILKNSKAPGVELYKIAGPALEIKGMTQ
jgi:hypothetical protein